MKIGIIYRATRLITNKSYIGKTIKILEKRKDQHVKAAFSNKKYRSKFYSALRKYPNESDWKWEVIYKDIPEGKMLDIAEMCTIYTNDSYYNGYNMTLGGDGGDLVSGLTNEQKIIRSQRISIMHKGKIISKETRKKMSSTRIEKGLSAGSNNPFFGKKLTKEHKKKISETRIKRGSGVGEKNPMFGKKHSKESKIKMSEAMKGVPLSEEHKRNISIAQTGKSHPRVKQHLVLKA